MLSDLISKLKQDTFLLGKKSTIDYDKGSYQVIVHNCEIAKLLRASYSKADLDRIDTLTFDARNISVKKYPHGTFIQAASFEENANSVETGENTNYDAIWVRDSIWGYFSLLKSKERMQDAKEVLLTILKYFTSQKEHFFTVINNPSLLEKEGLIGQMYAPHIRFDGSSPNFNDVKEDGNPQLWTHKQNDALGLTLMAVCDAISEEIMTVQEIGDAILALPLIVTYLDVVHFEDMPDSGAWEEQPARINTSSVALVTAGLERLIDARAEMKLAYTDSAIKHEVPNLTSVEKLQDMVERGYSRVRKNIRLGGESPDAEKGTDGYREADAAMYGAIYPAKLKRLTLTEKKLILSINSNLVGDVGIKRYVGDDYQSANFWFNDIKTDADPESMKKRKESFISDSEAQWFFDSWAGLCALEVYKESGENEFLEYALIHFNRSLAQITYSGDEATLGADNVPVVKNAFPESYNQVISSENERFYVPSPITPLNWAKASFNLLLSALKEI
jgi:hypothetical protein